MRNHLLSDNRLWLVIAELLAEKEAFTFADAEDLYRERFPADAELLATSDGHSLHQTIGGRVYYYSKLGASKRFRYTPVPPKIERVGEATWKKVVE